MSATIFKLEALDESVDTDAGTTTSKTDALSDSNSCDVNEPVEPFLGILMAHLSKQKIGINFKNLIFNKFGIGFARKLHLNELIRNIIIGFEVDVVELTDEFLMDIVLINVSADLTTKFSIFGLETRILNGKYIPYL